MRRTHPLAVLALAAAALTGIATTPATADATAAVHLDLFSEHNQTGDSQSVDIPATEGCTRVDPSFKAYSAYNHSGRFNAALYTTDDCNGEPVEVVGKFKKPNFPRRHDVASISFVE
ncbi:hypothetical protein [Streptosporangium sp. NPDC020145]|uniref:hypothetical protein n=1 Tax=Streptosporangium sp. NPDC020145 TaxID=3154694 RepID=UPI003448DB86